MKIICFSMHSFEEPVENPACEQLGVEYVTSRGAVVDAAAVIDALKTQQLGSFGMDVYEGEGAIFYQDRSSSIIPDDVLERLTTFPNVIVTGHQAWFTQEALTAIARVTIENATSFASGKPDPKNTLCSPPVVVTRIAS